MKILEKEHIDKIVTWARSQTALTDVASKIVNGEVRHEDQTGNYITLKFFDTPDPVKTTVRMEVRIHGKDENSTYGQLREIDKAFFNAFANATLPLEIDGFVITNIVPRQLVPEVGTKDRKESLRDYLFIF